VYFQWVSVPISEQDSRYTYYVTLWRVRVTTVAVQTQKYVLCIVELHVTVNNIKNCFTEMLLSRIYVAGNNIICLGFAVYLYSNLTKFGVSWQIFIQVPSMKFHGNPSSGSRADTCG
jgi:hypothetical protein